MKNYASIPWNQLVREKETTASGDKEKGKLEKSQKYWEREVNGLLLLLCFTVKVTQELCLEKGWHVNPGDVYPDYLRFCKELQLFLSSCYYSWAYSQSICRFRFYAEEANGWIQQKMTHCPMLCQSHWWLSLTAIDMTKCLERCPTQLHSRLCWNAIIIRTSK